MRTIVVPYIRSGGGHRAAASALEEISKRQGRPWRVLTLDIDETLEPVDPIYRTTTFRGDEVYNFLLRRGWTSGVTQALPLMHLAFRVLHPKQVLYLRREWQRLKPDLVVSVVPHLNRALHESLQEELPGTPFVTILTDLADYPPRFWIEPIPVHYVCGTVRAVEQARALAGPGARVWPVSGMILHPKFHDARPQDRSNGRRALGLDPALPTGVVLFGGYGSDCMLEIARAAAAAERRFQLIFLCGRNEALVKKIKSLDLPYPFHVHGFTKDVPHYMGLSDFFIGKPGPGSVSEALAMQLPVIVKHGLATLVQEQFNVDWIREHGLGLDIRNPREIAPALDRMLEPGNYARFHSSVSRMKNRAIFEVADILAGILAEDDVSDLPARETEGAGSSPRF